MILFVFEGKREEKWFHAVNHYFLKNEVLEYFVVGSTFHTLYKELKDNEWDIIGALQQMEKERGERKLRDYKSSDFAEVYLFFDYDPHSRKESLIEMNDELHQMLVFFEDETDNGKLYVNYPMVEAIRYTKKLPDLEYYKYSVPLEDCDSFKESAAEFSYYSGTTFLTSRGQGKDRETKDNWIMLKDQNAAKANFICCGDNCLPVSKSDIEQKRILEPQVTKYVFSDKPEVSILSGLSVFLYDYLK